MFFCNRTNLHTILPYINQKHTSALIIRLKWIFQWTKMFMIAPLSVNLSDTRKMNKSRIQCVHALSVLTIISSVIQRSLLHVVPTGILPGLLIFYSAGKFQVADLFPLFLRLVRQYPSLSQTGARSGQSLLPRHSTQEPTLLLALLRHKRQKSKQSPLREHSLSNPSIVYLSWMTKYLNDDNEILKLTIDRGIA